MAELLWVAIYIDVQISRCVNKDERLYAKKRMENARVNSANRFLNIVGVLLYAPYVWPIRSLMIFIVVAVTTVVLWRML
jgi:hypothetical protein